LSSASWADGLVEVAIDTEIKKGDVVSYLAFEGLLWQIKACDAACAELLTAQSFSALSFVDLFYTVIFFLKTGLYACMSVFY